MSDEERGKGWVRSAQNKKERAEDMKVHIERLKNILFNEQDNKAAILNKKVV